MSKGRTKKARDEFRFFIPKADGTPDRRYRINRGLKKDGTPDKRYKEENIQPPPPEKKYKDIDRRQPPIFSRQIERFAAPFLKDEGYTLQIVSEGKEQAVTFEQFIEMYDEMTNDYFDAAEEEEATSPMLLVNTALNKGKKKLIIYWDEMIFSDEDSGKRTDLPYYVSKLNKEL